MVSADSSVSVIDQVIQFTALFVIWFQYFWYKRLIKLLVLRARLIQLADGQLVKLPVRQMDLSQIVYILYKQIKKMNNFTSWASIKLCFALVFEQQKGQHFTDSRYHGI